MAAELLDVGLERLQLLRRGDLTGVQARLGQRGLLGERAGFVVETLLVACDVVAFGAQLVDPCAQLDAVRLRGRERGSLGDRCVTVAEPIEREVALLQVEQRFEVAHSRRR